MPYNLLESNCISYENLLKTYSFMPEPGYFLDRINKELSQNTIVSNSITPKIPSNDISDSVKSYTVKVCDSFVKKIIFNCPATIVFWTDGTKTIVKCMNGEEFNPYYGFVCAFAKKMFGANSAINRIIKEKSEYQEDKYGNDNHYTQDCFRKPLFGDH